MLRIDWEGGAALVVLTTDSRCNWSYCGGGPSFRDVRRDHFVAAIESTLGWDHPAAETARTFMREAK